MALTLQYSNIARQLPKVSYVKAVDVFSFGCLGFIFLTIVELALVGTLEKRRTFKNSPDQHPPEYFEPGSTTTAANLARRAFQKTFADRTTVSCLSRWNNRNLFRDTVFRGLNQVLMLQIIMDVQTTEEEVQNGERGGDKFKSVKNSISTWAKLEDEATFVECPSSTQPDPPSLASTSRSEDQVDSKLSGPPDSPSAAARTFWKQTTIKRRSFKYISIFVVYI